MTNVKARTQVADKPLRYLAVVICGYAVDFFIYSLFASSGQSIYLGHAIGFVVGGSVNVVLIRRFVFTASRFTLVKDVFLSLGANGGMLVLGIGLLWFMTQRLSINLYCAKLATNGITFVVNYLTRARFFSAARAADVPPPPRAP